MDEKKSPTGKKDLFDFNASFILMFAYVIYLAVMIFLQRMVFNNTFNSNNDYNYFIFIFISFLIGIFVTLAVYNGTKVLVAKKAGYAIVYTTILGLTFDHSHEKTKITFNFFAIGNMEMKFAPKDENVEHNPRSIFLAGYISSIILLAIGFVMFFALSFGKGVNMTSYIGYMGLFAAIYGFIIPIYELMPFRQDLPNDMFNLLNTKTEETRRNFNILNINRRRELNGQEFIVPASSDDTTYYSIHVLYYVYLDHLYKNELEAAVAVLDKMKENRKKFDDTDKYIISAESLYLRYLIEDITGADNVYLTLKGEEKSAITNPSELSDFRTSLFVVGFVTSEKDPVNEVITKFKAKIDTLEKSERVNKEIALFGQAYKTLREKKPELSLSENY
ncbi:MAG: hypothetical protein WCR67_00370 [Bacilli bacterium]